VLRVVDGLRPILQVADLVGRRELAALERQARASRREGAGAEPFFAWRAVVVAGRIGQPIPTWASGYLFNAALGLVQLLDGPGKLEPLDVLRTLELGGRRGKGPRDAYLRFRRDWWIAAAVRSRLDEGDNCTVKAAEIEAAEEFAASVSVVQRARRRFARELSDPIVERTSD